MLEGFYLCVDELGLGLVITQRCEAGLGFSAVAEHFCEIRTIFATQILQRLPSQSNEFHSGGILFD